MMYTKAENSILACCQETFKSAMGFIYPFYLLTIILFLKSYNFRADSITLDRVNALIVIGRNSGVGATRTSASMPEKSSIKNYVFRFSKNCSSKITLIRKVFLH